MIVLQAIRLDVYGRFQYRIEAPHREVVVTGEEGAVEFLRQLGIANPATLIIHVQEWGSIDLPDPHEGS
jgi:hypothetical protein